MADHDAKRSPSADDGLVETLALRLIGMRNGEDDEARKRSARDELESFYSALDFFLCPSYGGGQYRGRDRSDDVRHQNIKNYLQRRRLRRPGAYEPSGRVVYSHDKDLSADLMHFVDEVGNISTASARDGNGGREGMQAALHLAQLLLNRLPGADLSQITYMLGQLEDALDDLNRGNVHTALKPVKKIGRKPDARRDEFRRRCIVAAELLALIGAEDPFDEVFKAAQPTAKIVGPFKEARSARVVRDAKHPGSLIFSANTIRNWCEEHRTIVNNARKNGRRFPELPASAESIQDGVSYWRLFIRAAQGDGDTADPVFAFIRTAFPRTVRPENLERPINIILQDTMDELHIRFAPLRPSERFSRE